VTTALLARDHNLEVFITLKSSSLYPQVPKVKDLFDFYSCSDLIHLGRRSSSLLGNWDRLEITVTYSFSPACPQKSRIGGFI
jgi:hypothetical protein